MNLIQKHDNKVILYPTKVDKKAVKEAAVKAMVPAHSLKKHGEFIVNTDKNTVDIFHDIISKQWSTWHKSNPKMIETATRATALRSITRSQLMSRTFGSLGNLSRRGSGSLDSTSPSGKFKEVIRSRDEMLETEEEEQMEFEFALKQHTNQQELRPKNEPTEKVLKQQPSISKLTAYEASDSEDADEVEDEVEEGKQPKKEVKKLEQEVKIKEGKQEVVLDDEE